ncbi:MAG TPA: hypothetical protein VMT34_08075 [Aggregatilineales bacterium]|nr:hypothetical protein [Aggregatilineales bacterium]
MSDIDDLRKMVMEDEPFDSNYEKEIVTKVNEGRIFGLTAGERMILSIIIFLAVTVASIAVLLATNTIVLH